jgi:thiamine-phosphate pyrophosphorylase
VEFPPLQAIVDVDVAIAAGWQPLDLAARYLDGGAPWLQVRAKHLRTGLMLELCDGVVELARPYGATVIVNDRVDVARLSGAGGVHLGQDDLSLSDARELLGRDAIIGVSTHSRAQAIAAAQGPVSYVAVGPVFATRTKATGDHAIGLELVRIVAEASTHPLVAIGGITLDSAPRVRAAGAAAVAVITDLLAAEDPGARVREYLKLLD